MPLNPLNAPFSIEIKPSLQKYLIVTTPHVLALVLLIFISELPLLIMLSLISSVMFSFSYYLQLHCLSALNRSVISIKQDSINNWMLLLADESEITTAILMHSSFASNHLIILTYKIDNNKLYTNNYTVLITKDSLSKQNFRILKAKLNLHQLI